MLPFISPFSRQWIALLPPEAVTRLLLGGVADSRSVLAMWLLTAADLPVEGVCQLSPFSSSRLFFISKSRSARPPERGHCSHILLRSPIREPCLLSLYLFISSSIYIHGDLCIFILYFGLLSNIVLFIFVTQTFQLSSVGY